MLVHSRLVVGLLRAAALDDGNCDSTVQEACQQMSADWRMM
jgi:hypothetical protein